MMDRNLEHNNSSPSLVKVAMRRTNNAEKSIKCNQCGYASSRPGHLSMHLKNHSGEKSNKCNQYDYCCSDPRYLRRHLKTHSAEKSHQCNQCDYASHYVAHLRRHVKIHSKKDQINITSVTFRPPVDIGQLP